MTEKEGAKKHHEKQDKVEAKESIKAGDIVLADFDGWMQESNELFDTTSEALAKENNIYNEKMVYGPQPLIVGKGRLFPGFDEAILKAEVGKEHEVVLPSEKAAGPRDPKLVELHPLREFVKQEIEPRVGLEVTVKNRQAIITAVTAGRVRLDFNNRLAGKTLKYKFKVVEKPSDPTEITKLLLKMAYGTADGFEIEHHGKNYKIKLADACKYDQRWLLAKYRLVSDLREVAGAETISFIEEYTKPEKKEAEEKEEKPSEEKKEAPKEKAPEKAPEELSEEDRKGA
ncbi:MAG TPA: peptidylprolyl isomerase [Thermoplasmata archaeon]|jgi:FKBP-type peptidyl-prolyl cis-trans isomerase 2